MGDPGEAHEEVATHVGQARFGDGTAYDLHRGESMIVADAVIAEITDVLNLGGIQRSGFQVRGVLESFTTRPSQSMGILSHRGLGEGRTRDPSHLRGCHHLQVLAAQIAQEILIGCRDQFSNSQRKPANGQVWLDECYVVVAPLGGRCCSTGACRATL